MISTKVYREQEGQTFCIGGYNSQSSISFENLYPIFFISLMFYGQTGSLEKNHLEKCPHPSPLGCCHSWWEKKAVDNRYLNWNNIETIEVRIVVENKWTHNTPNDNTPSSERNLSTSSFQYHLPQYIGFWFFESNGDIQ